ncbi:MAG: hypothetical protein IOD03_13870 [Methylocystis sp.]|nr:hypothetical protein [Methylocystis sp.]MCA3590457.1 hypothetical protein [Methylocystis sp.]
MIFNMTLHGLLAIGYASYALCLLHDTGKMLGQLQFNAGRTRDRNRKLCRMVVSIASLEKRRQLPRVVRQAARQSTIASSDN